MNNKELKEEIQKLEKEYKELIDKYFEVMKRNEKAIERLKSSLPVCTCGEIVDILEGKNNGSTKYI
jgi:hypothetical protein